jgi:hypothetical protein
MRRQLATCSSRRSSSGARGWCQPTGSRSTQSAAARAVRCLLSLGNDSPTLPPVAPPGLEPGSPFGRGILKADSVDTSEHDSEVSAAACTPACTSEHGGPPKMSGAGQQTTEQDAVELALAEAIRGATAAARWDVVVQLARELEARRLARQSPEVANLDRARAKRDGRARPAEKRSPGAATPRFQGLRGLTSQSTRTGCLARTSTASPAGRLPRLLRQLGKGFACRRCRLGKERKSGR